MTPASASRPVWQEVQGGVSAAQGRHDQDQGRRKATETRFRGHLAWPTFLSIAAWGARTAPSCALPRAVIRGDQFSSEAFRILTDAAPAKARAAIFEYERSSLRSLEERGGYGGDTGHAKAISALDVPPCPPRSFGVEFAQEQEKQHGNLSDLGLSSPCPLR